jgi:hypothetical protein
MFGGGLGPDRRRWREVAPDADAQRAVAELVPDIVDITIDKLLFAIEEGPLDLYFQPETGAPINLKEAGKGEMLGWYGGGEGGWVTRFSRQRFYDYLAEPMHMVGPRPDLDPED